MLSARLTGNSTTVLPLVKASPSYLSLLDLWYKYWNHLRHCHAGNIFCTGKMFSRLAGLGKTVLSWVSTRCIKLAITKSLSHREKNHKQGTKKSSVYQTWCQNAIWQALCSQTCQWFRTSLTPTELYSSLCFYTCSYWMCYTETPT